MNQDLTYFINRINNLTILSPFRTNSDILIISDAYEQGIGSSIFQIKNYDLINKYIDSNLDTSNNTKKNVTLNSLHDSNITKKKYKYS